MICSFFAASVGIIVMIFASPLLVEVAFKFGPTEIFSIMLLGLLAGATMSRGSPLKGVAMTLFGLMCGVVGTDVNTGTIRFSFGLLDLSDGLELVAISMGLFGVADFLMSVNRMTIIGSGASCACATCGPASKSSRPHSCRWCAARWSARCSAPCRAPAPPSPPSWPMRWSARSQDAREIRYRHDRGRGLARGVLALKTQVDFIPTMSLGIPGDAVMALILGALLIQGIQPGPQLITEHPDIFWG